MYHLIVKLVFYILNLYMGYKYSLKLKQQYVLLNNNYTLTIKIIFHYPYEVKVSLSKFIVEDTKLKIQKTAYEFASQFSRVMIVQLN